MKWLGVARYSAIAPKIYLHRNEQNFGPLVKGVDNK